MSEDFEGEHGEEKGSGGKYKWLGIIFAIILAIAIPTIITLRTRGDEPKITLETLDTKLDEGITGSKSDFAWIKEKVANFASDLDTFGEDLDSMASIVNSSNNDMSGIKGDIVYLKSAMVALTDVVSNINTTLASCNCTCGGA